MRHLLRLFLLLLAGFSAAPALADCGSDGGERGVALLVGNSAYDAKQWPPLANAVNDIDHVCKAFAGAGFAVIDLRDATIEQLDAAIPGFAERAAEAPIAIVYFAGHGFEYSGRNFMVPVDAPKRVSKADLDTYFLPLEFLANAAAQSSGLSLFFMDACRTPDPVVTLTDGSPGDSDGDVSVLGLLDMKEGAVLYSTAKGRPALDAAPPGSPTSPFADAVARKLSVPGLELSDFFKLVARDVYSVTKDLEYGPQQPFHYGSWFQDYYLRPPVDATARPERRSARVRTGAVRNADSGGNEDDSNAAPYSPGGSYAYSTGAGVLASLPVGAAMQARAGTQVVDTLMAGYDLATVDEPVLVAEMLEKVRATDIYVAANVGSWKAAYLLGYMYEFGIGVERDLTLAEQWLRTAAQTKEPAAVTELAYLYQEHREMAPHLAEQALQLYEFAAEKNFAKAQSHLGFALWNGTLGVTDRERAVSLFRAASDSGHVYATFALGLYGGERVAAAAKLKELAKQGSLEGANWLCELHYQSATAASVAEHCLAAARGGYAGARVIVARLHAEGNGLQQSAGEARFWAKLALAQPELATRPDLKVLAERYVVK